MYSLQNSFDRFGYHGVYPCPICRLGQIQAMPLMEALACESCRHIFTADLERQLLKMTDRQPPLTWHWNGKTWVGAHLEGVKWGWVAGIFAVAFVILPPTLIGLSAYTFPPDPNSHLSWLPTVWTGLTFVSHLTIILWLVMEFYQFPLGVYLRVRRQQLFNR
ncbi:MULTISPECIES: hypothetical protein [unclassified Coleofasciculus]|uniref:hypothetical protein n=1 Tax=unclassified Coleofasciculus TaxID=2692782 RepID=UPI001882A0C7|nr:MULTISPECIES: hypothetical protein [unclassified Coleofasciculus]MBE9128976.1 hypothetical protein [Coleofasciculus sp. LEGE 07081]MBE9148974.1 hypothetical protein [Coleofasciculus sp. LEGE 07092]